MVTVNSSAGWQTVNLGSPVLISAGQTVWLAWVFQSNPGIRYMAGSSGRANSPASWAGGMPTSFGTSTMANYIYSIYCTYSTGGAKSVNFLQAIETDSQDTDEDHFLVYPNPTTEKVMVSWSHEYDTGLVLILVNSTGQTMKIQNVESSQNRTELDLGDNNAGIYFIMISDPGEDSILHRAKVIKSR